MAFPIMITPLINEHCELAENPLWEPESGCDGDTPGLIFPA